MRNQKPCVLFKLCNELFGIDVESVLRVINLDKLMKIPKAPEFIVGAISLEGSVIPVVDLAKKISLGDTLITSETKVLVLEIQYNENTFSAGVIIDDVLDVVTIDPTKLLPPTLESMGFEASTTDGLYKIEDDYYIILNATKVFESEIASLV
jgi:purine-binding chemotaxis protein CheW